MQIDLEDLRDSIPVETLKILSSEMGVELSTEG
jgi:hypothetical protein